MFDGQMKILLENVEFEQTDTTSAGSSNYQELQHLISGDITVVFGEHAVTYDEASVIDFAVQLAESIASYLVSNGKRIRILSPDYHDSYVIKIAGDQGDNCEVYLKDELICSGESVFGLLDAARSFIGEVRPLIKERYGHIKHIWDFYRVAVF